MLNRTRRAWAYAYIRGNTHSILHCIHHVAPSVSICGDRDYALRTMMIVDAAATAAVWTVNDGTNTYAATTFSSADSNHLLMLQYIEAHFFHCNCRWEYHRRWSSSIFFIYAQYLRAIGEEWLACSLPYSSQFVVLPSTTSYSLEQMVYLF